MERKYNRNLSGNARELRKNMTKEERHLWYDFLREYPVRFQRQKILGRYIADFYAASAKMVIELDGSQHYEEAEQKYDSRRTEYLEGYDILVIRIPNSEINKNFRGVCEYIDLEVHKRMEMIDAAKEDNTAVVE